MRSPPSVTSPSSVRHNPASARGRRRLAPLPFGPRIAVSVPGCSVTLAASRIRRPPRATVSRSPVSITSSFVFLAQPPGEQRQEERRATEWWWRCRDALRREDARPCEQIADRRGTRRPPARARRDQAACAGPSTRRTACGTTRPTKPTAPATPTHAPVSTAGRDDQQPLRAFHIDAQRPAADS